MNVTEKSTARKTAFAARKRVFDAPDVGARSEAANAHLTELLLAMGGSLTISGYLPIGSELDPRVTMVATRSRGASLCVPVVEANATPLSFREWSPDVPLAAGAFGVMEPTQGPWMKPDVLIVPMLAFDGALNRLGYGGGFYDRTLQSYRAGDQADGGRAARRTRAIGFAFAGQQVPKLPLEATDQPLDALVTEDGIMWADPQGAWAQDISAEMGLAARAKPA